MFDNIANISMIERKYKAHKHKANYHTFPIEALLTARRDPTVSLPNDSRRLLFQGSPPNAPSQPDYPKGSVAISRTPAYTIHNTRLVRPTISTVRKETYTLSGLYFLSDTGITSIIDFSVVGSPLRKPLPISIKKLVSTRRILSLGAKKPAMRTLTGAGGISVAYLNILKGLKSILDVARESDEHEPSRQDVNTLNSPSNIGSYNPARCTCLMVEQQNVVELSWRQLLTW